MRSRAFKRGFTLIEVMVAVAITALMGIMIAAAFSSGFHAKDVVEHDAEHYRSLRAAFGRMTRELSSAFVSDHYDSLRFRDQNDRPSNFIGERNKLTFTSFAHQRLYAEAKESDQMVVEYAVKTSTDRRARGRQDLIRRENPLLDGPMDKGGTEDALFEGAKQVEFAYWDSDKKDWVEEWDTRRLEKKGILPSRVKITLFTKDENGKDVRYSTQARIMLNTTLPRY